MKICQRWEAANLSCQTGVTSDQLSARGNNVSSTVQKSNIEADEGLSKEILKQKAIGVAATRSKVKADTKVNDRDLKA